MAQERGYVTRVSLKLGCFLEKGEREKKQIIFPSCGDASHSGVMKEINKSKSTLLQ